MKKMRKLIPAFAMLMVAAIMMSTASYAWFTMSASVTATGMSVKAKANGGLVMSAAKVAGTSYTAPGVNDYAANIDLSSGTWYTNGAEAIFPTSTNGTDWFKADATQADYNTADGATYDDLGETGIEANEDYYLATMLYFKAVEEGADYTLTITDINVTATTASLDQALRVALKVGTSWYYFAPNYTTANTLSYTTVGNDGNYTTANYTIGGGAAGSITLGDTPEVVLSTTLRSNVATEVEVYVYYEGEDENCKSAFAVDINTLSIELGFSATETPAP